jgi:hypothetical protein
MACAGESGGRWGGRPLLVFTLIVVPLNLSLARAEASIHVPEVMAATGPESPDEAAVRKLLSDYARAIENKDLVLFRSVKPNLTKEEESRLQKAFASVQSQVVKITIQSIQVQVRQATVRLLRRDTIDSSTIASFPQTLLLDRGQGGWTIREINR